MRFDRAENGEFKCACGRTHKSRDTVRLHTARTGEIYERKNSTDRESGIPTKTITETPGHSIKNTGTVPGKGLSRITLAPEHEIPEHTERAAPFEKVGLKPLKAEKKEIDTCGKCGYELTGRPVSCPGCGARLNWKAVYG